MEAETRHGTERRGELLGPEAAPTLALWCLTDEVRELVDAFLPGWAAARMEAALRGWLPAPGDDDRWRDRCAREFRLPAPRRGEGASGARRADYRRLHRVRGVGAAAAWCHRSRSHGLGERVASPQLFVGPAGRRLFCYGGWAEDGPRSDLLEVPLATICGAVAAGAAGAHPAAAGAAAPAAAEGPAAPSEGWSFRQVRQRGRAATRAGVQSLTPLWFRGPSGMLDAPPAAYRAAVAEELGACGAGGGAEVSLLLAFGGAQGGYRNENNDWALGALREGTEDDAAGVFWGRPNGGGRDREGAVSGSGGAAAPLRRAAHTATYVPARLLGDRGSFHPEGLVVVFGGHTEHCQRELASVEVLALAGAAGFAESTEPAGQGPAARHGHSATLVEVDGRGFLVVVGGGVGNILGGGGLQELSDATVLDLQSWAWLGRVGLTGGLPGRHHTACAGLCGQILLFGGGARPVSGATVLDGEECVRRAASAGAGELALRALASPCEEGVGAIPTARKMHGAACLLPWAPLLVVVGGWECVERSRHFDDLWVLALGGAGDLEAFGRAGAGRGEDEPPEDDERPRTTSRMLRVLQRVLARLMQRGMLRRQAPTPDEE